jgi:hypothetical protein
VLSTDDLSNRLPGTIGGGSGVPTGTEVEPLVDLPRRSCGPASQTVPQREQSLLEGAGDGQPGGLPDLVEHGLGLVVEADGSSTHGDLVV